MKDKDLIALLQEQIAVKDKQIDQLQQLLRMKVGLYNEPIMANPKYDFFTIFDGKP